MEEKFHIADLKGRVFERGFFIGSKKSMPEVRKLYGLTHCRKGANIFFQTKIKSNIGSLTITMEDCHEKGWGDGYRSSCCFGRGGSASWLEQLPAEGFLSLLVERLPAASARSKVGMRELIWLINRSFTNKFCMLSN